MYVSHRSVLSKNHFPASGCLFFLAFLRRMLQDWVGMMACQVCTAPPAGHESWDIQTELPPFPDLWGLPKGGGARDPHPHPSHTLTQFFDTLGVSDARHVPIPFSYGCFQK